LTRCTNRGEHAFDTSKRPDVQSRQDRSLLVPDYRLQLNEVRAFSGLRGYCEEAALGETRSGGCLCGSVRYQIPWPPLGMMACHCTHCQKQSGSALSTIAMVPRAAVELTGTLTEYQDHGESGGSVLRRFCGKCGSPIISDIPQEGLKDFLFIKTGSLDDTSGANPTSHLWTKSAQEWFVFPEGVAMVEKQ
jgi:hypothetical protein